MTKHRRKHDSGCPVAYAADLLGDRWTLILLRDLLLHGKRTYSEFLGSEEAIASNILVDRLAHLETEGIVSKERSGTDRRANVYRPTAKAVRLSPVILEIIRWSAAYLPLKESRTRLVEQFETDRDQVLRTIEERANADAEPRP